MSGTRISAATTVDPANAPTIALTNAGRGVDDRAGGALGWFLGVLAEV